MSDDQQFQGPDHSWQIGAYRFSRYSHNGKWECSAHGRGVGSQRGPLRAFLALRRWLKEEL